MVNCKGIIFDLDGTLLDTIEDLAWCMNSALKDYGLPGHDVAEYFHYVGDGVETLVKRAMGEESTDDALFLKVLDSMRKYYSDHWHTKTQPYKKIPEILLYLVDKKIPIAINTNKPHPFAIKSVAHFFPGIPFVKVIGGGETFPLKPSPDGALDLASHMGFDPGEVCYIGDSDVDIKTASNAGMSSIGAAWGFRGRLELEKCGATKVYDTPSDLFESLQKSFKQTSFQGSLLL